MGGRLRAIALLLGAGCVLPGSLPILAQLQPSRCPAAHPLKVWYTPTQGPQILARIEAVTFEGDIHLPVPDQERIATALQKRNEWSDAGLSELRKYVRQDVRVAWQEHGYFKVNIRKLQADVLTSSPEQQVVAITLYLEEGPLYRLGDITFKHVTAFPQGQVRALFPMQPGDVFNTDKVRIGLDALRSLYGTRGYLNFTSVPDTQIDEVNRRISLVVDVDQGRQFRVSGTEIVGLQQDFTHTLLQRWPIRPGEVYNTSLVEQFFKENAALLPAGANPEDQVARTLDPPQGTAALTLDFRSCFVIVR